MKDMSKSMISEYQTQTFFFSMIFSLESLGEFGYEEVRLKRGRWRIATDDKNIVSSNWKVNPQECVEYVKEYAMGGSYVMDLQTVCDEAEIYAKTVELNGDGKDVWIFDIDETLISNIPYYNAHGYDHFDHVEFGKWVEKAMAPAIEPSLKLYQEVLNLGFKVILLSGRNETQRSVTVDNLTNAGFCNWHHLILRGPYDKGKTSTMFKSEKRREMEKEGYRIHGNTGDQWSDLLGFSLSICSFKLPIQCTISPNNIGLIM